jgi:shikimate kinase
MKNIVLTGFMGAGKTAVGKELARLLDMRLIDLDSEIEKAEQTTINEIFKQSGEKKFREIETEMIKKVTNNENIIISTGGGAVMKQENIDLLKKTGIIICLIATPETILQRTGNNSDRPLLQVANPLAKINELLNLRKPFYEKADIMIDTEDKTPLRIAKEIVEKIRKSG